MALRLVAALALAPAPASAQDSGQAATNTPATDAVGPSELENFSINGTVTRPADPQPAARQPARTAPAQPTQTNRPATMPERRAAEPATRGPSTPERREIASKAAEPPRQTAPAPAVTVALPKLQDDSPRGGNASVEPAAAFPEPAAETATLGPGRISVFLPWLLAAIALGAGGAFLFYRRRHAHGHRLGHGREAFAGGPAVDSFAEPEVQRAPPARPAPPPPAASPRRPPSSIPGLVSTRLRPWIDLRFHPLRCILEDHQVTVEFELELLNSGSAPARAVLVEASLFNAGPDQDAEIGRFFANPVGQGDRIASIQPLKRLVLKPRVVLARELVQVFEVGGRKVFVPLIAFNALYKWGSGEGQSSVGYLLGRDTTGDKLAPFRLDLGPRIFRGLGSRLLPNEVRQ
ncbi:MAG TPA: hypothetical protein VM145_08020 [Sphingomicrobium sp.]|nr:hypothetical protein [Sphingomicrobium sp.]